MAVMLKKACVKADWLPLPDGLDLRQSMIFGTAGITAVFALQALECHGLSPERARFWSQALRAVWVHFPSH